MKHEAADRFEHPQGAGPADAGSTPAAAGAPEAGPVVTAVESPESEPEDRRRLWVSLGLVVATLVGSILVGVTVTVPIVMLLFMRLVSRESWRATVITTVLASTAFYLVFVELLGVPLEGGTLLQF
jgi:hypothetical protein